MEIKEIKPKFNIGDTIYWLGDGIIKKDIILGYIIENNSSKGFVESFKIGFSMNDAYPSWKMSSEIFASMEELKAYEISKINNLSLKGVK